MSTSGRASLAAPRCPGSSVAARRKPNGAGVAASLAAAYFGAFCRAQQSEGDETLACVAQLPRCMDELLAGQGRGRSEEELSFGILQNWLSQLHVQSADGAVTGAAGRKQDALRHLLQLAPLASERPGIALAVAQSLIGFFWWGEELGEARQVEALRRSRGPSLIVAETAFGLQELAVRYGRCDTPATSRDEFLSRQCPWRLRCLLFLGAELGRSTLSDAHDLAHGFPLMRRTAGHLSMIRRLPFFDGHEIAGPLRLNQNWDYFPAATSHWSVWPVSAWPSLAHFLKDSYATIRADLEGLLAADAHGELFKLVSQQQADRLAPAYADWSRLDLVNSGGQTELCKMVPALRRTCELLAPRPEINAHCETYLAGAALSRLLPGTELRPHFDTHARLAAHLGLRTPAGASMTVGGEEVVWREGEVLVFDDTYVHSVRHDGDEPRYVLITWFCHPCDLTWRAKLGEEWRRDNPLPAHCGEGGGSPPIAGYGNGF